MEWTATALLVVGGFICGCNLLIPLVIGLLFGGGSARRFMGTQDEDSHVSSVPVIGSLFVAISLFHFWQTTWILVLSIVLIVTDIGGLHWFAVAMFYHYVVKRGRLLHRFTSEANGRHCDIRLFKRSCFTIQCEHERPFPCCGHDAFVQSYGFDGNWHEQEDGFRLESYAGERALEIHRSDDNHITIETGYPSDAEYPYDKLDSLELTKIK